MAKNMFQLCVLILLSIFLQRVHNETINLSVNVNTNRHPISQYIYGINWVDKDFAKEISLPVNRWGGNAVTRYNWKLDVTNRASDWFYENIPEENAHPDQLPNNSSVDRIIADNVAIKAQTILTLPLIGWTPKSRDKTCGFSVKKYGEQEKTDEWTPDCGNGKKKDGTKITGNDPKDTSIEIGADFIKDWIKHLTTKFGTADKGGVMFYDLDNEYDLWHETHRDVHPKEPTGDELVNKTTEIAAALKAADPKALTLGPVGWGYMSLFGSDADKTKHGDVYLGNWYLKQMKDYEDKHKVRILDYFDCHIYPQGDSIYSSTSDATNALRIRQTRLLWDTTYVDESWIKDFGTTGERTSTIKFIPRMKDMVAKNYPGTKIAITEYNWGGMEHMSGAIAQADVLGIFGREQVDLAALWGPGKYTDPWAYAFRLFRNYDGKGGKFGDTSVSATSPDQSKLAIYGSTRDSDTKLILAVINKDSANSIDSTITITSFTPSGNATFSRYGNADHTKIVHESHSLTGATLKATFPAYSITMIEISGKKA